MTKPPGCTAKQTPKRIKLVNEIMEGLTNQEMYKLIGNGRDEASVTDHMYHTLLKSLRKMYLAELHPDATPERADNWARKSLLWERDVNTTINNIMFLGTGHRPDFVVQANRIRIAIEVKRGDNGASIRDALGQCVVYASYFEFVCCVLVDTSKDKRVLHAFEQEVGDEQSMLSRLWGDFNVRLAVV